MLYIKPPLIDDILKRLSNILAAMDTGLTLEGKKAILLLLILINVMSKYSNYRILIGRGLEVEGEVDY